MFADFREANLTAKKIQLDLSKPDSAQIDEVNQYMALKKTLDERIYVRFPENNDSPINTISTDRTTSPHNTTIATSLGSTRGNGAYVALLKNRTVGQKRKCTREAAQDEAKEAKRRSKGSKEIK